MSFPFLVGVALVLFSVRKFWMTFGSAQLIVGKAPNLSKAAEKHIAFQKKQREIEAKKLRL